MHKYLVQYRGIGIHFRLSHFFPGHGYINCYCIKPKLIRMRLFLLKSKSRWNWDIFCMSPESRLEHQHCNNQRALVLLVPLLTLDYKSTSLGAGIHMWVHATRYDLLSSGVFLSYFSMLSINVAGVLQEAGDADSRARTRSQV